MPAQILINAVAGSDDDLPIGVAVQLDNVSAETDYAWLMLARPEGSAAALTATNIRNPQFTPDVEGSYRFQLIVNAGAGQLTDVQIAGVRQLLTRERIPATGEETEVDATEGWAGPAGSVDRILRRVADMEDAGVVVWETGAAGLLPGDVLYPSDTATLKSGLPGEDYVPIGNKALATTADKVSGTLGVLLEGVDGSGTPASGDLVRVQLLGLVRGLAGAPTVGDPVYVSDAAAAALTAGTVTREIGTVSRTGAGTYDYVVSGMSGASVPSGAAGGVLGYTGSVYPNPNGFAPGPDGHIHILSGGPSTTMQMIVDKQTVTGSDGSFWELISGGGADGDAFNQGALGGGISLIAGPGGDWDAVGGPAGPGGMLAIRGGYAGAGSGADGADGGDILIQGGLATGDGWGGPVGIYGGTGGDTGSGGQLIIGGGSLSSSARSKTGGYFEARGGENSAAKSSAGGEAVFRAGDGSVFDAIGATDGGAGGIVTFRAGDGGIGDTGAGAGEDGGPGSDATVRAGDGGAVNAVGAVSGIGGDLTVRAGHAGTHGAGTASNGGDLFLRAGDSSGATQGGSIALVPGDSGLGRPGQVVIGATDVDLTLHGRVAYKEGSQSITADTDTVVSTLSFIELANSKGGAATLTSTPNVSVTNVPDGQRMTLINVSVNTITIQSETNLAGSKMYLSGGANRTLSIGGVLEIVYSSGMGGWVETNFVATTS